MCVGLLELQAKIECRAQHILNTTPDAPKRVTRESQACEQTTPLIFDHMHAWLLQHGTADELYDGALTIGAGTIATRLYKAAFGTPITQLEHGYVAVAPICFSSLFA